MSVSGQFSQLLLNEINSDQIDLESLKKLVCDKGVPGEESAIRLALWSLLLKIVPKDRFEWGTYTSERHQEYSKFCQDFIINPESIDSNAAADHPLSTQSDSQWKMYFEDKEMQEQIDRDVERTHPDLNFFSGEYNGVPHRIKMSRALFIFYKLNPGIRYVQGMNEIYAVLYYVLGSARGRSSVDDGLLQVMQKDPEVSAFFGFVNLMSEFRDNFCLQLDKSHMGIGGVLGKISHLVKSFDPILSKHLEVTLQISPHLYAFRWVTTLFTQEFDLPDVISIWDRMISDQASRSGFVIQFCASMVLLQREVLLQSDFAHAVKLLQHYPDADVATIIRYTEKLQSYKTIIILDE
jgi:hypothetical protein